MPQADGSVANGNGAQVRAEINSNLSALFTNSSGDGPPLPGKGGQTWFNTGRNPNRFEIKKTNDSFVPLRDEDGRVILPTLGYNSNNEDRATPSIYFDNSPGTGFFHFESNVVGFAISNDVHYVLGRSVGDPTKTNPADRLNQKNAFLIGPASYNPTKIVPTLANAEEEVGFCVSDTGECHIGTDGRPLTLNTFKFERTGGLINFNANGKFRASIQYDIKDNKMIYGTPSDYRLKSNVAPLKGAKTLVNKLKPREYNMGESSSVKSHGFIAHEVQKVLPNGYVVGKKDETFPDGSPKYQQIDYSHFTPLLTAALQEAFTEIAVLTERVQALEAKANG